VLMGVVGIVAGGVLLGVARRSFVTPHSHAS